MIRLATYSDIPALKHIRRVCFEEENAFLDLYFSTKFTEDNTLVYLVDAAPVATLTLLEAELQTPERTFPVAYIYAVATLPGFRRRGLAEALLHRAGKLLRERGVEAAMLVPASEELFAYYIKLGYTTTLFVAQNAYEAMKYLAENAGAGASGNSVLKFCVTGEGMPFGLLSQQKLTA